MTNPPRPCPMGGLPDVGEHNDTPPEERLHNFLKAARAAYEEAKINHNTGKCTAAQLENVRLTLANLERAAAALSRPDRGTL